MFLLIGCNLRFLNWNIDSFHKFILTFYSVRSVRWCFGLFSSVFFGWNVSIKVFFFIWPVFNPGREWFCSFKLKKIAVSWISTAAVSAPASTTAVSSAISTATTAARGCGQSGPLLPRTDCCGLRYALYNSSTVLHIHSNNSRLWLWSIRPLTTQDRLLWS